MITTIGIGSLTELAGALPCPSTVELDSLFLKPYSISANDSYFPKTTLVESCDHWLTYEIPRLQRRPVTVLSKEVE